MIRKKSNNNGQFWKFVSNISFDFWLLKKYKKRKNKKNLILINTDLFLSTDQGLGDNFILLDSLVKINLIYRIKNEKAIFLVNKNYIDFFKDFNFDSIEFYPIYCYSKKLHKFKEVFKISRLIKKDKKNFHFKNNYFKNVYLFKDKLDVIDVVWLSILNYENCYKTIPVFHSENDKLKNIEEYKSNISNIDDRRNVYFSKLLLKFFSFRKFNITTKEFTTKTRNRSDLFVDLVLNDKLNKNILNFLEFESEYSSFMEKNNLTKNFSKQSEELKILVNPFSTSTRKNFSLLKILSILDYFSNQQKIKVTFIGKDSEIKSIENIIKNSNFSYDLVSHNNLFDLTKFVKDFDLIFCNESGFLHISKFLNINCVCFVNTSLDTWNVGFEYWLHKKSNIFYVFSNNENFNDSNFDAYPFDVSFLEDFYKSVLKIKNEKISSKYNFILINNNCFL